MDPKFMSPARLARNFIRRLTVSRKGIFPQSDDVVLHIFEHVAAGDAADVLALARVCRLWHRLALDSSVWHNLSVLLRVPIKQHDLRQMRTWDRDWEALAGVTNLVRNERISVNTTRQFAFRVTGLPAERPRVPSTRIEKDRVQCRYSMAGRRT
ncbi:hypothetical protein BC937DRAFT_94402 [Endogone sp. FLAS-F59071]|nr:hypothetical protein BC937DRAFT_94402 [Endogone sp. FLAS-F59071]|eukprot:RUS14067.1 hypothetical protein BC937DRAFT_94402 [Endogone sp. FLAS-F59071]